MSKELFEALNVLEKENNISKEVLFEAIENSLLTACKNHFGRADNIKVYIDREKCDFAVYAEKEVVENVEDPLTQEEMDRIAAADCNCRLIKGQVFLWPGASSWHDLWDEDGIITQ